MKNNAFFVVAAALTVIACLTPASASSSFASSSEEVREDNIFQVSVIRATVEGLYDGVMTFGDLKEHGNFGIGTFERLDGELVVLDGVFYQLKADGTASLAEDSMDTPLATVTFFDADRNLSLDERMNFTELESYLDEHIPTENIFYAIRIDGSFDYLKTRSVPAQEKPYPPLAEAVKEQTTLEFRNVTGTIVGFRYPDFAEGLGLPGYHMHFITSDRSSGGHLLDCVVRNASISIDEISEFEMALPKDQDFLRADLSDDKQEELKEAESNPAASLRS
jgi:acetolactate decarboxylase